MSECIITMIFWVGVAVMTTGGLFSYLTRNRWWYNILWFIGAGLVLPMMNSWSPILMWIQIIIMIVVFVGFIVTSNQNSRK